MTARRLTPQELRRQRIEQAQRARIKRALLAKAAMEVPAQPDVYDDPEADRLWRAFVVGNRRWRAAEDDE